MQTDHGAALLFVLVCVLGFVPFAAAEGDDDGESGLELGLQGGFFLPDRSLSGRAETLDVLEPLVGPRLAYRVSPRWSLFADATWARFESDGTSGIAPGALETLAARSGVELYFGKGSGNGRWFSSIGGGRIAYDPETGDSFRRSFASLGAGRELTCCTRAPLRWELRADRTLGDSDRRSTRVQALIGMSWGVGRTRCTDCDHDGVPDAVDPAPHDPDICGDSDGDNCDDCAVGTDDFGPLADNMPNNDGEDCDSDGACDAGDPDDDNDGVRDATDRARCNPDVCADADRDDCDDCAVGTDDFGPLADNRPDRDGADCDGDGACDTSDPDDDDDGVPDVSDPAPCDATLCGDADRDGCDDCVVCIKEPDREPSDPCVEMVFARVGFEFNRYVLTSEAQVVLDGLARPLKACRGVRLEVAGHTDAVGTEAYNLKLSRRRAEAVRKYLVGRGVADTRLSVQGYGERVPRDDNDTDAGRARNRRVVLDPVGGCCMASGGCRELPSEQCRIESGRWLGAGTACEPDSCAAEE